MRAELRPSSLGEILDRTAQMYRSHFLLYFGIASISYAGVLALSLLLDVLFYPLIHSNPRAYAGIRVVVAGIIGLIAILPVAIAMAAVMHAVARNYLGQPVGIREAYADIRRRWYRYILILLAMYVYSLVPLGALMGLVVAATTLVHIGQARGVVVWLAVILMLVGIVIAFWWMLRWGLSMPASLMEDLTVHRALKRSSILTKGGIGRIFVMLLLVGAIMLMIQYAIQIPTMVLVIRSRGVVTLTTQIISSLGSSFSGAFVLPIYSIALTLFYYDQRIRKEGYDVEWLMEQAGMKPDAPPVDTNTSALPASVAPQSLTAETLTSPIEPPAPAI